MNHVLYIEDNEEIGLMIQNELKSKTMKLLGYNQEISPVSLLNKRILSF